MTTGGTRAMVTIRLDTYPEVKVVRVTDTQAPNLQAGRDGC
jgi:hypothetical protein